MTGWVLGANGSPYMQLSMPYSTRASLMEARFPADGRSFDMGIRRLTAFLAYSLKIPTEKSPNLSDLRASLLWMGGAPQAAQCVTNDGCVRRREPWVKWSHRKPILHECKVFLGVNLNSRRVHVECDEMVCMVIQAVSPWA
jgi:hypothetical protein